METLQQQLLAKLETYDFQCEGGPLVNCEDWQRLKDALRAHGQAGGALEAVRLLQWSLNCVEKLMASEADEDECKRLCAALAARIKEGM